VQLPSAKQGQNEKSGEGKADGGGVHDDDDDDDDDDHSVVESSSPHRQRSYSK
jgi:hypothetical protein